MPNQMLFIIFFILAAFNISIISCSLELQSSHGSRKLLYSSFRKCEYCLLKICMCSNNTIFSIISGKKATVIIILLKSSSHRITRSSHRHPIVSLIVIPSSGSAEKTLLVLPCVSLLVTSLN
jgi:hypothetical protein